MTNIPEQSSEAYFDPDDVGLRDSPPLRPMNIKLRPSPSPEAIRPPVSPESRPGSRKGFKRSNNRACQADAVLVSLMGGGKRPDIAHEAGNEALPSDEDEEESPRRGTEVEIRGETKNLDLTMLAADALKAHEDRASHGSDAPDGLKSRGSSEINGHRQDQTTAAKISPISRIDDLHTELESEVMIKVETRLSQPSGGLPPIRTSPQSGSPEGNGPKSITLPSINDQLGDINKLSEPSTQPETAFCQSPPAGPLISRFNSGPSKSSPSKSPNEIRRELPSPARPGQFSFYVNSQRSPSQSDGIQFVAAGDYSSGSNTETPSTDQSGSTPATAIDRMSIDEITNPQVGGFRCIFPGCNAAPFSTQYLLNSHANVHSQNRPHYCVVKGCPRGEGGKGFKRKNEMIRHGLVHDSPGYVCPFCPDREHKYPRPDNLQRHVRVHHVDKDRDDPQLREVLSQRPEGGNRGRRRRGGT